MLCDEEWKGGIIVEWVMANDGEVGRWGRWSVAVVERAGP
jgi:hypothetical protein